MKRKLKFAKTLLMIVVLSFFASCLGIILVSQAANYMERDMLRRACKEVNLHAFSASEMVPSEVQKLQIALMCRQNIP